jgi:hypothetical protein
VGLAPTGECRLFTAHTRGGHCCVDNLIYVNALLSLFVACWLALFRIEAAEAVQLFSDRQNKLEHGTAVTDRVAPDHCVSRAYFKNQA